jgi:integrase
MRFWTAEQARQYLSATADDRLAWVWALLLTRGARRGEVCGLKWYDLDLDAGTWRVTRTRIVVGGKAVESTPKTAAGRRVVPLDASLVTKLRAYRAVQATEKLAAGPAYQDAGWLFCDELGVPYYPDSMSTWFDRKVKALGIPRIRLHDCRHTAASIMLASGRPARVVGELIGHASPSVTLAVYGHLMPGATEEAGAALSASLLGS